MGILMSLVLQTIESIPSQIAARLKERRLALGWSRTTLAERAAVAPATLRAFERTGQISLARLARLAVALGLDAELERLFSTPPIAQTLDELAAQAKRRQRGRRHHTFNVTPPPIGPHGYLETK